ncbi:hypothetical protein DIPPA_16183 [Diplonema papillatum]|nr:hypothetical protein DIPPA_16183 [Diplonema papillatum]
MAAVILLGSLASQLDGFTETVRTADTLARVRCTPTATCSTARPVCCGVDTDIAYCFKAGYTCCDPGNSGEMGGGCPMGTDCCFSKLFPGARTSVDCCLPDESCHPTRGCVRDSCSWTDSCAAGCSWCCATNSCMESNMVCAGAVVSSAELCPDRCNLFSTCESCTREGSVGGCGWCCSSARCMHGDMTSASSANTCGRFSFIGTRVVNNSRSTIGEECTACATGLVLAVEPTADSMWLAVGLAMVLSGVCCIGCTVLFLYRMQIRRQHAVSNSRLVPDGQPLPPAKIVAKYRFGEDYPENGSEPEHESRYLPITHADEEKVCVACVDQPVEVVFLPCNHICCCRSCALTIEETHVKQQRKKRCLETTSPACPLCREDLEAMVCYPTTLTTQQPPQDVSTPPLPKLSPAVTPTTSPFCRGNTPPLARTIPDHPFSTPSGSIVDIVVEDVGDTPNPSSLHGAQCTEPIYPTDGSLSHVDA